MIFGAYHRWDRRVWGPGAMTTFPSLIRSVSSSGEVRYALGDPLVDRYLEFVAGRARPKTLRAVTFDLKTFFTVVVKDPVSVVAADVFDFLALVRPCPALLPGTGPRQTVWAMPHAAQDRRRRCFQRRMPRVVTLYKRRRAHHADGIVWVPPPTG